MVKKEEIQTKILDAAVQEFLEKGLESGSMESIAKEAQISKRTLYKYFPNKDAIFDALIEKLLASACGYGKVTYLKSEPLKKQLEQIIETKAQLLTSKDYINISRLVMSEVMKKKKLNKQHLEKFYESELYFLKWIDAAKKDGKIISKQSAELISNQLHSIIKGQLFYPVLFGIKSVSANDIKTAKKIAIEFFINSFC